MKECGCGSKGLPTLCIDCMTVIPKGRTRCPRCQTVRDRRHNNAPQRAAYRDVEYRSMVRARACVVCGATDDLTLDHIVPLSRGGTNTVDNIRTVCRSCNSAKGGGVG